MNSIVILFSVYRLSENRKCPSYCVFLELKIMSSNCWFCLSNSQKPKDSRGKQKILTSETSKCLVFSLEK